MPKSPWTQRAVAHQYFLGKGNQEAWGQGGAARGLLEDAHGRMLMVDARSRMLIARWWLLALLPSLPVTVSWPDLTKSARDPGPEHQEIPPEPQVLLRSLPRITVSDDGSVNTCSLFSAGEES